VAQISFLPEEQITLNRLGIRAVILFGSQALGISHPNSDYDIAIIGSKTPKAYDYLYDLLSQKINQLVNIDLVFLSDAPMELKNHVARHGQVLYQSNPTEFANFKEKTMTQSADFAPLQAIFSTATLSRI